MQRRGSAAKVMVEPAAAARISPPAPLPLVSPAPAFHLKLSWYGPVRPVTEPKRFKVAATIQIEGELTADELRAIFLPAERLGGRVSISAGAPEQRERDPQEDERKKDMVDRANRLVEAYRAKLGEPPSILFDSLFQHWIEEFGDEGIREAIDETARARDIVTRHQKYEFLKEVLRVWRRGERSPGGAK